MKKRNHLKDAFEDNLGENWETEFRDFEHGFPDWFDAVMQAMDSYAEQQEWAIQQMNRKEKTEMNAKEYYKKITNMDEEFTNNIQYSFDRMIQFAEQYANYKLRTRMLNEQKSKENSIPNLLSGTVIPGIIKFPEYKKEE